MFPVLIRIGRFEITSFGVMFALSFWVAGVVISHELRRKQLKPDLAWELVLYAAVGGILGAKLYYMVLNLHSTLQAPWRALISRAGLVWYGGVAGAVPLIIWRIRRSGVPFLVAADAIAPAVTLAYAVGRIGCFLVGDDYGRPTSMPWGVAFPRGAPPSTAENLRTQFGVHVPPDVLPDTVLRVHPTQLYETGLSLIIFLLLWRWRGRFAQPGLMFSVYLVLAGAERFIVEIFRAKDDRFFGPLSLAQAISVLVALGGVFGILKLRQAAVA